jgi:hypothetical protein
LLEPQAVCVRCAEGKELPLARCAACGHLPAGREREESLLASRRMLDAKDLAAVQARLRSGERLNPGEAARARARALLHDTAPVELALETAQLSGLLAANVLLTPLIGWAAWLRWRSRPGPAARQALIVTAPVSAVLGGLWIWWGFGFGAG